MAIKPVDMEQFYQKAGNVYQAIIVTAKRARQIHDELRIELNQRLETVKALTQVPGETEEDLETVGVNPDQLKISLEFETRPKPSDEALGEVVQQKFEWRDKDAEETTS